MDNTQNTETSQTETQETDTQKSPQLEICFSNVNSPQQDSSLSDNIPIAVSYRNSTVSTASTCICRSILNPLDPRKCILCKDELVQVQKVYQEKSQVVRELNLATLELENSRTDMQDLLSTIESLRTQLHDTRTMLEIKQDEYNRAKQDLDILGDKLTDAIEQRAELQHAKEALSEELEELTRSLFEEANTMVANEARLRNVFEKRGDEISKQLEESQRHLQLEQAHLRELRVKYSALEHEYNTLKIQMENELKVKEVKRVSVLGAKQATSQEEFVDPALFSLFEEIIKEGRTSAAKMHNLQFMKNALEDEVIPCLRFGGNPRTSTKKFVDAMVANTCFLEELSEQDVKDLENRDREMEEKKRRTSVSAEPPQSPSIFNKTVLERFANAMSLAEPTSPISQPGCTTCGRRGYSSRFKISDFSSDSTWYPICQNCADRLQSVCDFYQFMRNLRQGLYSSRPVKDLYMETVNLKRNMFYTRIGAKSALGHASVFSGMPVRMDSFILSP